MVVSPLFTVPNDNSTVIKYTTKHGAKTKEGQYSIKLLQSWVQGGGQRSLPCQKQRQCAQAETSHSPCLQSVASQSTGIPSATQQFQNTHCSSHSYKTTFEQSFITYFMEGNPLGLPLSLSNTDISDTETYKVHLFTLAEAVRNAIVLSSFLCWLGPTQHIITSSSCVLLKTSQCAKPLKQTQHF